MEDLVARTDEAMGKVRVIYKELTDLRTFLAKVNMLMSIQPCLVLARYFDNFTEYSHGLHIYNCQVLKSPYYIKMKCQFLHLQYSDASLLELHLKYVLLYLLQ